MIGLRLMRLSVFTFSMEGLDNDIGLAGVFDIVECRQTGSVSRVPSRTAGVAGYTRCALASFTKVLVRVLSVSSFFADCIGFKTV